MSTEVGFRTAPAPARTARTPGWTWVVWALVWCMLALAWQAAGSASLERAAAAPAACALREWTGLACPTCGATRALVLMAHGQWSAALALHPLPAVLAVQVMALWLAWGAWLSGAVRSRPDRWVPHVAAVDLAGLVLLWVARIVTGTLPV